jgi:signal transduction histidine kinase
MSEQGNTGNEAVPAGCETYAIAPAGHADHRLSTIFEIARILATEHDLPAMLHKFLCCLVQTFEVADAGMLLLVDAGGFLTVAASLGYQSSALADMRLAPGESITGLAFQSGQPALYATPEAARAAMATLSPANREIFRLATGNGRSVDGSGPSIDGEDDQAAGRQPLSAICIPLSTGAKKVGVLLLENLHQPGSFTTGDLDFLRHVADLISLSIDNAGLRAQLQSVQALSEGNRLKAELISTLAHEMRTPLTSIKGYSTALLMEDAYFSPETQQEFLQIIDEECDILQDLIHDLLESSIIDAGFLKLELEPVLLSRLAHNVVDDIARRTERHRFLVDFPANFPIVEADPHRIVQVLRNLLDNAVKYSPAGGLVVVRGEVHPREVVISVADQGEGIAPEHLNRLFEKFFRIKSGLGRHVVGAGLGLPIARTIVESHGGRIWAESVLQQGTTFNFTLPLRQAEEPQQEQIGVRGGGE